MINIIYRDHQEMLGPKSNMKETSSKEMMEWVIKETNKWKPLDANKWTRSISFTHLLMWEKILGQREEATKWQVPNRLTLFGNIYFTQDLVIPPLSTRFSSTYTWLLFLLKRRLESIPMGRIGVIFFLFLE